mmetsp:Transcript_3819/g.7861  ORF Transcript_3819/g.7861 Transcript_3819/m.7861 type:complete len:217 (+) Transcript_3819:303-953(+)
MKSIMRQHGHKQRHHHSHYYPPALRQVCKSRPPFQIGYDRHVAEVQSIRNRTADGEWALKNSKENIAGLLHGCLFATLLASCLDIHKLMMSYARVDNEASDEKSVDGHNDQDANEVHERPRIVILATVLARSKNVERRAIEDVGPENLWDNEADNDADTQSDRDGRQAAQPRCQVGIGERTLAQPPRLRPNKKLGKPEVVDAVRAGGPIEPIDLRH